MTLTLSTCGVATSTTQPPAITSATATTAPKAVALFCAVPIPESWKSAIASGLVTADGTWTMVGALAPVGDKIVKEVLKGSVLHLEVGSPGGKQRFITNIANTYEGGHLPYVDNDGQWVVYSLTFELLSGTEWTTFAWDSHAAAAPHKIADSRWNARTTLLVEAVHQGKTIRLTGSASDAPGGSRTIGDAHKIHLYDLATGHDQVVRVVKTAILSRPFFGGNLLVWPESDPPGDPTQLKAYDMVNGTMANLPDALKTVRDSLSIAADTKTWTWGDATFKQLWVWRTDWAAPKKIFDGGDVAFVSLAGDIVTWVGNGVYAADLRSGSYVKLTSRNGYSIANGTHFEFMYGTRSLKSNYAAEFAPQVSFVVDVSKLPPLPTCSPSN
jgi:hypothetical protein